MGIERDRFAEGGSGSGSGNEGTTPRRGSLFGIFGGGGGRNGSGSAGGGRNGSGSIPVSSPLTKPAALTVSDLGEKTLFEVEEGKREMKLEGQQDLVKVEELNLGVSEGDETPVKRPGSAQSLQGER